MPSACRNQRKRTETTETERKPAERCRRKENAGRTRSCATCLRFVFCREFVLILVCTQGAAGSNPAVSTNPHLERGFAILPPLNSPKKQRLTPFTGLQMRFC